MDTAGCTCREGYYHVKFKLKLKLKLNSDLTGRVWSVMLWLVSERVLS